MGKRTGRERKGKRAKMGNEILKLGKLEVCLLGAFQALG
jgi:hypothetical protein